MSAFVSKSQQRGSPLSLSRSRFSIIIYRSGDRLIFVRIKELLLHAVAVGVGAVAA